MARASLWPAGAPAASWASLRFAQSPVFHKRLTNCHAERIVYRQHLNGHTAHRRLSQQKRAVPAEVPMPAVPPRMEQGNDSGSPSYFQNA